MKTPTVNGPAMCSFSSVITFDLHLQGRRGRVNLATFLTPANVSLDRSNLVLWAWIICGRKFWRNISNLPRTPEVITLKYIPKNWAEVLFHILGRSDWGQETFHVENMTLHSKELGLKGTFTCLVLWLWLGYLQSDDKAVCDLQDGVWGRTPHSAHSTVSIQWLLKKKRGMLPRA